jgi:hypothetical protein
MTNIQEEARRIVADNIAANEESPWFGYAASLERQLMIKTGCDPTQAYYAIAEASKPHTLTLGQIANRIIDLEDAIRDLLTLCLDRIGPDAEKMEAYTTARRVLTQKANHGR